MSTPILAAGLVVAAVAAARSTWSPCGLSMLSTITPFSERARGHRYWATALWFIAGSASGGACLGGGAAAAAWVLSAAGAHGGALAAIGAAVAGLGAAVDAGLFGPVLPLIRRQVDDRWLGRYRPWVYGAGFGWQVGVGLATYLMTAGVVVVAALAALTVSPSSAVLLGVAFGLSRGLTVLLTARAVTPARLRDLHRRLDRLGSPVRWAAVGAQSGAAVVLSARASALVAVAAVAGATLLAAVLGPLGGAVGSRTAAR